MRKKAALDAHFVLPSDGLEGRRCETDAEHDHQQSEESLRCRLHSTCISSACESHRWMETDRGLQGRIVLACFSQQDAV